MLPSDIALPPANAASLPSNAWHCLQLAGQHLEALDLDAAKQRSAASAVALDNRGLAYADGFFTTIGVVDGQILWQQQHRQRLLSHAKALQLDIDCPALMSRLSVYGKQLQQGMLKLVVTRSTQAVRGYGYAPDAAGRACDVWLKVAAMPVKTAEQITLPDGRRMPRQSNCAAVCLSAKIASLPPPLAGLKSLNRLDNVLASGELQRYKTQWLNAQSVPNPPQPEIGEGLLRDMSGHWVEGTMSNVFYQLAESPLPVSTSSDNDQTQANYLTTGQWYTPSMAQSGVAGVMRQVIIDALANTERPVVERSLHDEDLPRITRLFFCNALRGVMPMSSLTLLSGEVVELN